MQKVTDLQAPVSSVASPRITVFAQTSPEARALYSWVEAQMTPLQISPVEIPIWEDLLTNLLGATEPSRVCTPLGEGFGYAHRQRGPIRVLAVLYPATAQPDRDCLLRLKLAAQTTLLTLQLKAARAQSAALKQDQERVVRHERLRAQAEAIRSFAHEFNNILATILLRAELALPTAGDERLQQCFQTVYDCAVRGAQVVQQLQDFSGAQPRPDQDLLDLGQLVRTITQGRWPEASRTTQSVRPLRLQTEAAEDLHVMASAADVGEIVGSLLANACEAMPEGGLVTVKVTREKRQAVVRVIDQGAGMAPEVLTRACEPFFTTKGCEHLGLGLSVIHGIVSRSGGRFTLANSDDGGLIATVGLPLADLRSVRRELRQRRDEEPELLRNLHVLVVDDEPGIRETLALSLESMGHKVSQAVDGRQAMGLIRYHDGFDALVVDLVMPDIDGWEVAFLARKLQPQAAIVLLTAWGEKMSVSTEDRADAVLAKPLSVKELNVAICRQVRHKRQELGLSPE